MFEIIVRAIICDKNRKILLVKRAKAPEKDKWSLAGGKVEPDETADQAIIREVREELGLTVIPEFVFYGENIFPEQSLHTLILYFRCSTRGNIQIKRDEIAGYGYYPISRINAMHDIAWDHRKMLLSYFKGQ